MNTRAEALAYAADVVNGQKRHKIAEVRALKVVVVFRSDAIVHKIIYTEQCN